MTSDNREAEQPMAVDAERSMLGAILLGGEETMMIGLDLGLAAEHFYDRRHQLIFFTIQMKLRKGEYADPITVARALRDKGELMAAGGPEYMAALADIGAAPVNVKSYAALIVDMAMRRATIAALAESHVCAFRPGESSAAKVLDEAEARLLAVGDKFARGAGGPRLASPLVRARRDLIVDINEKKDFDRMRGLATGFPGLDEKTAGLHGGDLIILAGRPGAGKTAFALNIVRHVSAVGAGVCFFSLEMSGEQLVARMISQGKINAQKIRTGRNMQADDFMRLAETAEELENRKLYIDDSGSLNMLEVAARTRRLARSLRGGGELGLIVVDYLQLLANSPGETSNENRATQVAMISRSLKALARDLNVPVLALSQLNRAVEGRPTRRPQLSDLRESGAIEQDADLVLLLHNKERGTDNVLECNLIIAKQRNGPVGTFRMRFERQYSLFGELSVEEEE